MGIMVDDDYRPMLCLGKYLEESHTCTSVCQDREICIKKMIEMMSGGGLAGLPEFLVHSDHYIRECARSLVEHPERK